MIHKTITVDMVEAARKLGRNGRPMRLDSLYRLVRGGAFEGACKIDGVWAIPVAAVKARIARRAKRVSVAPAVDDVATNEADGGL